MTVRARIRVTGRVQGVFYRQSTREMAEQLGLDGWVRNLPDGSVEGLFEGEEAAVNALVAWSRTGPPAALVERVDTLPDEYRGEFTGFSIRY